MLNASLVDAVFQVARDTTVEEVNRLFEQASKSDRLRVADRQLVNVIAWYDDGWGYANRLVELAALVAASSGAIRA